tara:strand:+ start:1039 stop:2118 length:1080 start_codon:yes stop_codon:yes gene_type:complete
VTSSTVFAEINLDALHHNLNIAKKYTSGSKIIAVVKSMAYGHGATQIASSIEKDVAMLAVARVGEGVELREAGLKIPIVILEGPSCIDDLKIASQMDLQLTFHDGSQIVWLDNHKHNSINCWLKLDSGMNRLGFQIDMAEKVYYELRKKKSVNEIRLMTHLACADDLNDQLTNQQINLFNSKVKNIEAETSIANSAGILAWPESHSDWVRPGLMLYGASPIIGKSAADFGLQPVMTLKAPIIAKKEIKKGSRVGYGGSWVAPEKMPIGIISIGYGDGYPRNIGNKGKVLIHGTIINIIGRVSMDMIAIDLRETNLKVGDIATLWGNGLPVDHVSEAANTIPYTLLCNITTRIKKRYISS